MGGDGHKILFVCTILLVQVPGFHEVKGQQPTYQQLEEDASKCDDRTQFFCIYDRTCCPRLTHKCSKSAGICAKIHHLFPSGNVSEIMEECCWNNDSNFIGCQTIRSHKSLEDSVCKRIESSTTSIQETPLATGQLHAEIAALQEQIRYLTLANDILISGQAVLLEHIRNLTSEQAVFLRNLTESQSNRSCGQNPGDRFDIWILVTVNVSLIVFILGIGAYQNRNRLKELVCRKQNQRPEIGKDADGTDHDRRRRYLGGHELAPTSANIQIRRDSESSSDC